MKCIFCNCLSLIQYEKEIPEERIINFSEKEIMFTKEIMFIKKYVLNVSLYKDIGKKEVQKHFIKF